MQYINTKHFFGTILPLLALIIGINFPFAQVKLSDCIEDSFGDCCESPFQVWQDQDNDGLGNPDVSALACIDYAGWVQNGNDPDDSCYSNVFDCNDNCNGSWKEDQFGDCCPDFNTYFQDLDGDGLGNPNISIEACNLQDGWSEYPNDPADNCFSNQKDCNGVCDGSAYYDDCGVCDDNALNDNISCTGCMDEAAINFNPDALIDDGGCIYPSDHIWHVSNSGSDEFGLGTVDNPFETINHTISVATEGDTILVHSGIYYENINYSGKNLFISSMFAFTNDLNFIDQTIIDGNNIGSVVTFESGESEAATLIGFTITNGFGSGTTNFNATGGGITIKNYSHPSISYCYITENISTKGGGVYILHSNPELYKLKIYNNSVINDSSNNFGGGVFSKLSDPNISDVEIFNNLSERTGGGIYFRLSNAILQRSYIHNNTAYHRAGGIDFSSSKVFVNKTTIVYNAAYNGGGGIQSYFADSYPIIVNSIIWNNSPDQILYDNDGKAGIYYSNILGGWQNGINILSVDPLFSDVFQNDFTLTDDSPCIDMGISYFVDNDTVIVDMGIDEYNGFQPDMGADETEFTQLMGDVNQDNTIDVTDLLIIINYMLNSDDFSDYELWLCDLNGDGFVNILDIIILVLLIVNG